MRIMKLTYRSMRNSIHHAFAAGLVAGLGMSPGTHAQPPANFPTLVISSNGPVAPGDFIGTLGAKGSTTNNYNVRI